MKISVFCEHILPRPWKPESEYVRVQQSLEQFELADKAGFHCAWMTEHHFLEEYSHASAPEVFLAALAARTKNIRLGHGIIQMLPGINHPARVAERIGMLDLISGGRVEFGTGEGASETELGGFSIDAGKKREMWREGLETTIRCMADTPFSGIDGEFVKMPPRNVIPKPYQKPHPPLWVACTREETIALAAENGLGALSFSFATPEAFKPKLDLYYNTLAERCVPIGRAVNANILASSGQLLCAATDDAAMGRVADSGGFFGFGIHHYHVSGNHQPGATNLWEAYQAKMRANPGAVDRSRLGGVGSPERLRNYLRVFEAMGVDQAMFLLPPVKHEYIMESLELMGKEVLPEFIERDHAASLAKAKRVEPIIEAAMKRARPSPAPIDPDYRIGAVPVSWDGIEVSAVRDTIIELERRARGGAPAQAAE